MVPTHKRKNTSLLVGSKVDQIGFSMCLYLPLYPMMLICIRLFGYRYRLDSRISDVMKNPTNKRGTYFPHSLRKQHNRFVYIARRSHWGSYYGHLRFLLSWFTSPPMRLGILTNEPLDLLTDALLTPPKLEAPAFKQSRCQQTIWYPLRSQYRQHPLSARPTPHWECTNDPKSFIDRATGTWRISCDLWRSWQ